MKISASIYSNNKAQSPEQLVQNLDAHGIDMLHVDCLDNAGVFDDIRRIRQVSNTPIDLHIISATPEKYIAQIEELGIEYVSFQYENLSSLPAVSSNGNTKYGISITASMPIEVFEKAKGNYSFIVMMCTTPGKSGGTFQPDSFQKIIDFKHRYPKTQIHVDGGVNDQVAFVLRVLGVNAVVSGNYLINHESLGAGMLSFHKASGAQQAFKIADFATPLSYLPVLKGEDYSFKRVLETIEKHGQGFVAVTDNSGKLQGIISNADVRRGLLRHIDDIGAITADSIVNKSPVTINENDTVADMIRLLNNLNFIVLFLPVVDAQNVLKGAVLLNHLTRV